MKEKLLAIISSLRGNPQVASFDEAATKQAIVLRVLDALGWDQFDVAEVAPEYAVGGRKVDHALRLEDSNKVFLEVKRTGVQLEIHQDQILDYSYREGVPLAVLTNGIRW